MSDSRAHVRIRPETETFAEAIRRHMRAIGRMVQRVTRWLSAVMRDIRNPPSPERLWIRERGRAEMAEAELWFARHIAGGAA